MTDQKQPENVKYLKYFCSIVTYEAKCTREINCRIAIEKAAFNKKKNFFASKLNIQQRKKLVKHIALYGAESWTLRKVD